MCLEVTVMEAAEEDRQVAQHLPKQPKQQVGTYSRCFEGTESGKARSVLILADVWVPHVKRSRRQRCRLPELLRVKKVPGAAEPLDSLGQLLRGEGVLSTKGAWCSRERPGGGHENKADRPSRFKRDRKQQRCPVSNGA